MTGDQWRVTGVNARRPPGAGTFYIDSNASNAGKPEEREW